MEIIGALKKSKSNTTIFFCEYQETDFEWSEIVALLQRCRLMQDLDEKDIYCVAIESADDMATDKTLVGIVFRNGKDYISLVPQNYADLDFYMKELVGDNNE